MRPFYGPGYAALLLVLIVLGGCNVGSNQPQFEGYYLPKAQVVLSPDPEARRPSQLESGENWIVLLTSFQKGGLISTGRGRQTTIIIEFAGQPPLDRPVDLASEPLQVSYEYGGEATLYISREISGTMILKSRQDGGFVVEIDATFIDPILGDGSQVVKNEFVLLEHPHPDFR